MYLSIFDNCFYIKDKIGRSWLSFINLVMIGVRIITMTKVENIKKRVPKF